MKQTIRATETPRGPRWNERLRVAAVCFLLGATSSAWAQGTLSPFSGSTAKGSYEADFARLAYPASLDPFEPAHVEGSISSRLFVKPEGKSNYEVFRSYERELRSGGFTVHLATALDSPTSFRIKTLYDPEHTPGFAERRYEADGKVAGSLDLAFTVQSADHYLVASRETAGRQHWVAVLLSGSRPFYLVEELATAAMEEGTVALDLEALRSSIDATGKIAIYDIHFATGSAEIEPRSHEALGVVADYLREATGGFYIVGHTDDTGTLSGNLTLSDERAAAVKQALIRDFGISARRLETRGVGPLAPVSNNTGQAGRALNRRVEIVQRLP